MDRDETSPRPELLADRRRLVVIENGAPRDHQSARGLAIPFNRGIGRPLVLAGPRYLRIPSSFLHRLLAAAGVALVLVLGVLAANPELHQRLHPDAGQAGHECGVTLFLHGVEAVLVTAAVAAPPVG
ncbi:MAG TPA: hypothetical protein VLT83_10355 [Opitutaceae bacterium]|nr:hypothetical protein [Opitutaceae bacterium]